METKAKNLEEKGFDAKGFWVRFWSLLNPSHKQLKNLIFFLMLSEIVKLVGPFFFKLIIDSVTNFHVEDMPKIIGMILVMFVSFQVFSFLNSKNDKKIFRILADVHMYIINNAQKKMTYLTLGYHEKENTGNKIAKIIRGVDKITDLIGNLSWEVVPTIFQIIFTTIVLFIFDWRFGMVILVFVPIFIVLTLRVNRRAFIHRKERFINQEEEAGVMSQAIININTVKSFVQENRECSRLEKLAKKVAENLLDEFRWIIKYNLKRNFVIDLGRALLLLAGVFLVWKGSITIGSLVFIYTITEKALLSLFRISRLYDRTMESSEAVERIYDLTLEESEIKNPKNGIKPERIEGQIEFKNTSFVYSESSIKALNDANFTIQSGCVTALVGPSGGGKTTVARMVYRHYDPISGEILLDSKNLKEYDLYAFRKFIAIVPQEVEIFNTSVRENISYAKPGASFKEVQAASRIANAEEFINQLNDGYETLVGERGIKLSGGQRQRIGIARAILANPKILIFDEATSSLDSYSEKLIQEAMDKIRKGRTVIIIAHRLSTIKKADKIVVLEKGKVIEEGSHFELAKMDGGLYQKLIKLQEVGDVE
jgi:ATP-binding cassette, subfamily B, bacterial